jgi:branched-chain amino acid transport system ATP-binding protein
VARHVLEVDGLHVSYGRVRALHGVSLRVEEGKVVVLLGANGAGKSTLLKAISNLVPAQAGAVRLWGEASLGRPPERIAALGVAHVPEGRGVFAQLSVRENLLMGAYLAPPKEHAARYETVTRLFPRLKERWNQRAGNLSGGEQQMLALGRALVMRPRLLLLDEPSLGLAPLLAREAFQAVKAINQQGVSVLVVEQNARLALSIADYAYVLRNGRVETQGTAEEVSSFEDVQRAYLGVA